MRQSAEIQRRDVNRNDPDLKAERNDTHDSTSDKRFET